jgi:hypothetical protein
MARRDIPFAGILVPDERIRTAGAESTIAETGTTTTAYQQAGPTAPGAVDLGTDVVVALSGEQASSVYLNIGRGGEPDPARGARLRWADSATDTLLGWAPPTWITNTSGTNALSASDALDMIPLADGRLAVAVASGPTGTECAIYEPNTDVWTAGGDLPWQASETSPTNALLALWQDPDDDAVYALQTDVAGAASVRRMLVKSTDGLGSWSTVAQTSFTGGTIVAYAKKARWYRLASGAHVLIVFSEDTVQTWRSSSGEDWRLVGTFTGIAASSTIPAADAVLLPDGRLLYAYVLSASSTFMRFRLCDALTDPSTAVQLSAAAVGGALSTCAIALEETGRAWVFATQASQGGRAFRSLDYSNWVVDDGIQLFDDGSDLDNLPRRIVQLEGGHVAALADYTAPGGGAAPFFAHLGGWSSFEPWSAAAGLSARDSDRLSWGAANTSDVSWLGIIANQADDPTTSGVFGLTTGGVQSVSNDVDVRTITTGAGYAMFSRGISTFGDSALMFCDVKAVSGGSFSQRDIGWKLRTTPTASTVCEIECFIRTGGFRLKDTNGATLATVIVSMASTMQFMVCIESTNRQEVYYKRPYEKAWTSAYQAASVPTRSLTSAGTLEWGNGDTGVSGTATSHWRGVFAVWSTSSDSATAKRDQWRSTNSTVAARQQVLGRPLASSAGQLGDPSTYPRVSLLSVAPTAGIAAAVEPAHAYPVDHLDPIASPSPRQVWRSTGVTEQIIEWHLDASQNTADLTYYGLYLGGANFRQAFLEYYDGGSWQAWVEVDLGETVAFTRSGNTIEASSGNPRWLQQHEAVGGHVDLGSSTLRAIEWNSTGYGSADGTRSRIRLTGVDGGDPASGSGGVLVMTRGVAASLAQVAARRVRLRIPAQTTVDGYFKLGVAAIGRIYALGSPVDFGSGQSTLIDVRTDESPGYVTRARRSPPRRRWSLAIAEANVAGIRDGVAGYLAADGAASIGIGIEGDVAPLLEGLLAQGIDASPVLVLPSPVETQDASNAYTTTETRRDVIWWGSISAVQWDNVVGRLGGSELHRVATVNIEEDV